MAEILELRTEWPVSSESMNDLKTKDRKNCSSVHKAQRDVALKLFFTDLSYTTLSSCS